MGQVSKVISSNQLFDQVSLKREYKQDIFRPIRGNTLPVLALVLSKRCAVR